MTPLTFAKLYALTVPVFFAIDLVWLAIVARPFYRQQIGHLLRPDVRWGAALVFYLLFLAGLLAFAVVPAIERHAAVRAVLLGALFGLVTYATYDLTNLATLKSFPMLVAVVDMAWGTVLCAGVAGIAYRIGGWLVR